ncbi:MAG: hypothetical protein ACTSPC_13190 [Candidatus Heimdallarchaeota archaeon]
MSTLPTAALTIAVIPFSLAYYLIAFKQWEQALAKFSKHLHGIALSADQFANKSLAPVLNLVMVNTGMVFHPFGDEDDTLSYVIAMNFNLGTLSGFGKFWAVFLNFVDYRAKREGTNHLEKSIYNKYLRDKEAYDRLKRQGFLETEEI